MIRAHPATLSSLVLFLVASAAPAQERTIAVEPKGAGAGATFYGDSWAVVIGINDYQHPRVPKLQYAVNDARAVERLLLAQGFRRDRVITLLERQATKAAIERVLGDELRGQMGPDDRLLVFFAGHGKTDRLRSGDLEGYLIPADGDPGQLYSTAISMESLRRIADRLPAKHILYVVDACYSGYAVYNRSIGDDLLAEMVRKPAIQILTAGRQGDEAQERGGHGVFTEVLLRGLEGAAFGDKSWLALEELGVWVKQRVFVESGRKQLPQFGSLHGEGQFVFLRPVSAAAPGQGALAAPAPGRKLRVSEEVTAALGSLAVSGTVAGVEVWLGNQKIGETRSGRVLVVADLAAGAHRVTGRKPGYREWASEVQVTANQRTEVLIDLEPLGSTKVITGDDGAEMVLVPAGEFWMGSDTEGGAGEKPRHKVHLDSFYIDRFEVTNARYRRFTDATGHPAPAHWSDGRLTGPAQPVVGVSWLDADLYCRWAGKRLPTEAEWEKAARGTDERRYPWGDQWEASRASSGESSATATLGVGSRPGGASPYGVHDMAGNVWEWVADWYDQHYYRHSPERNPRGPDMGVSRVLRGGSWLSKAVNLRAATRLNLTPVDRGDDFGFRCAKGAP